MNRDPDSSYQHRHSDGQLRAAAVYSIIWTSMSSFQNGISAISDGVKMGCEAVSDLQKEAKQVIRLNGPQG
jgi:hypothetical protein